MKYFDLKGFNVKAFRATVMTGLLLFLIVLPFFFIGVIARHGESSLIVAFLVVAILLFLTKRLFRTDYRIGVSGEQVVFLKAQTGLPLCPPVAPNEIGMILHKSNLNDDYLRFIRRGDLHPFLKIGTMNQAAQVHELLVEIGKHAEFTRETTKQGWTQYLNREAILNAPANIERIRRKSGNPGRKNGKIILLVALGVLALMIAIPALTKSGEGYRIGVDEITYNGVPLDIDRNQYEWLSGSTVKDSTHVFFNGQIVEWADAPTFENIGRIFFRDKNGLYQERINLFTPNKLTPLTGDFDAETLTGVDQTFYKDKDRVYYFDFNLASGKNPLKQVKLEGIHAPTFEALENSHVWYRDAKQIYFGGWADFRACPEIDRKTFEVLTWQVAKDRNNVYYLTRFLASEGKKSTERDNYAILEGAHAPTFVMIDHETFEDRNTAWVIESSNDRTPQTPHRRNRE